MSDSIPDTLPQTSTAVRAVRGASSSRPTSASTCWPPRELITAVLSANDLTNDDLISMLFTATPDLHSEFPALAARELGIGDVPLLCTQELDIAGAMPRVIRVMVHVETPRPRPRSGTSTCAARPRCAGTWRSDPARRGARPHRRHRADRTAVGLALRRHGVAVHLADPSRRRAPRPPTSAPAPLAAEATRRRPSSWSPPRRPPPRSSCASSPRWPDAVVTDVAGGQGGVLREVAASAGRPPHFVGTHPMAGRERSGPRSPRGPTCSRGAAWVVSPGPEAASSRRPRCATWPLAVRRRAGRDGRRAPTTPRSPLVSHVPQVAASLVAARLRRGRRQRRGADRSGAARRHPGRGLRPDLWIDILAANAEPVARASSPSCARTSTRVVRALARSAEDPDVGRGPRCRPGRAVASGNAGRARLPGKHGAAPRRTRGAGGGAGPAGRAGPAVARRRRGRGQHRGHPHRALAGAAGRPGRARGAAGGRRAAGRRAAPSAGWGVHA